MAYVHAYETYLCLFVCVLVDMLARVCVGGSTHVDACRYSVYATFVKISVKQTTTLDSLKFLCLIQSLEGIS